MEILWLGGRRVVVSSDSLRFSFEPADDPAGPADSSDLGLRLFDSGLPSDQLRDLVSGWREGAAFVVDAPGEYEVRGAFVVGVQVNGSDDEHCRQAYCVDLEGLRVAHMGALEGGLRQTQVEDIGAVDLLCLPVGGALTPEEATEIVRQLDPALVLPLAQEGGAEASEIEAFLKAMGSAVEEPEPQLKLSANRIPDETRVVVLEVQPSA